MSDLALPYGLRDTKLTAYTTGAADELEDSVIDQPNARTLSFSEAEDFEELRGDDKVVAIRGKGPSVEWEMESGGISLNAYAAMAGGTITTTGVSPDTVTTFRKKATDARPYFKAEGQAISDNGGDFHAVLYRCRASGSLEGEMSDGAFWLTSASGQALPSLLPGSEDALYDFVINETVTPIGGETAPALWVAETVYMIGSRVSLGGGAVLEAINGGTSDDTEPTAPGIGSTVVDGTVEWLQTA